MGIVNFSIPKSLVLKFLEHKPIDNFIETGTYKGATTFWASNYFKSVYTIEIEESLSNLAAGTPNCPKILSFSLVIVKIFYRD